MNTWNVGHAQHGFGDRPEEQPLEPGSAVRRHRDHAGRQLPRRGDDLLRRLTGAHRREDLKPLEEGRRRHHRAIERDERASEAELGGMQCVHAFWWCIRLGVHRQRSVTREDLRKFPERRAP
jgi:hypothetical protein